MDVSITRVFRLTWWGGVGWVADVSEGLKEKFIFFLKMVKEIVWREEKNSWKGMNEWMVEWESEGREREKWGLAGGAEWVREWERVMMSSALGNSSRAVFARLPPKRHRSWDPPTRSEISSCLSLTNTSAATHTQSLFSHLNNLFSFSFLIP